MKNIFSTIINKTNDQAIFGKHKSVAARTLYVLMAVSVLLYTSSCNKLVNVGPAKGTLDPAVVFADSSSVQAAVAGMYSAMYTATSNSQPYGAGITFLNGLYADDITNPAYPQYQGDALTAADAAAAAIWLTSYQTIYRANSIIQGIAASNSVTATVKQQATGEAKFIRALCHFYLVNTYGNVPLITTTDATVNSKLPQSAPAAIYQQIIADLKDAVAVLPANYNVSSNQRTRANKYAAIALLAKAYLYTGDYVNAEAQATLLINNTGTFSILADQTKVFLTNSTEAIFQFDSTTLGYPYIVAYFVTASSTVVPQFIISPQLLAAFEPGDTRKTNWIGISGGFPFPYKYKSLAGVGSKEFDVVLRLAEQYLIRAEARAQQGNIPGAQADLNVIRNRSKLPNTTANDQGTLLLAVEQERRVELFCEWGNRFFDLKRTKRIDAVLGAEKPGVWKSSAALYPIPATEIGNNTNLIQNQGY